MSGWCGFEDEEDDDHGDAADGQVNVKAPPPGNVRRKRTAQQRADDARDTEDCTEQPHILWSFRERDYRDHEDDETSLHARDTETCDRSTDDEGDGVGRCTADDGADFEDGDHGKEHPFGAVEGVDFAEDELEGGCGEHKGAGVPADVVEGVEFICDLGDGRCDDCAVLETILV